MSRYRLASAAQPVCLQIDLCFIRAPTHTHKMLPSGCFVNYARLLILAVCLFILGVQGMYNISEPDRQTHMYGRDFIVAFPPDGWKMEAAGSFLQIACVSVGFDPRANGSITLIGEGYSETFIAAPIASIDLKGFKPRPQSNNTTVLDITSDSDIIVTLILQIGQTLSAYTAIPVKSLDKVYLVASYGLLTDNLSELTVVATSPIETTVSFKKNDKNVTLRHQGSDKERLFNLLRGQSYIYETSNDFIGGHLQCSEPVMGLVGSRCSDEASGCSAHSMENLHPLVSLGRRYTAVVVNGKDVDNIFRAVAVWNNTEISWSALESSSSGNVTLANGQTKDLSIKTSTIIGSKPFLLLHHVKKGTPATDIALVAVPPHEQLTRKTITFATYPVVNLEQPPPKSVITIIKPCDTEIVPQLISLSRPRTVPPDSELPMVVHLGDDVAVCGTSEELDAGVYTLEVRPDIAHSSYSAILYTFTETGVAAHILATELNQVVCSVESRPSEKVHLCPARVHIIPQPTAVTAEFTTSSKPFVTTHGGEKRTNSGGTIIAVVIVIVSLVAGAAVISFFMFRYCRGRRWKRLEESDYMEDNPIRLRVLEQVEQDL